MELEAGSPGTVYRVSYTEESVGKMVKTNKTRITWEFVAACGGRHHSVVLAWSKPTGKHELQMDGTVVWFGRHKGRSVLDHHWTTPDESLKIHVLATCAPKLHRDFRNYDLLINGQLFASLPHRDGTTGEYQVDNHHHNNNNKKNNSIIQILYPDGYSPPVDKNQQQQQKQQPAQQTASSNGASAQHPPMVDLLV